MGKDKLRRFAENLTFERLVQPAFEEIFRNDHALKGHWHEHFFRNDNPIVLELGCGKGEYTVALAERNPERNYIGVDIKGARMWRGAKTATEKEMPNVGFVRTRIEFINSFFAEGEVDEIWITFPDPQLKKTNKRLTSTRFLSYYRRFMGPDGIINLKTDSPFLYEYTRRLAVENGLEILDSTDDLYSREEDCIEKEIKTFYEQQWLSRGKTIKLLKFRIGSNELKEPDVSDLEPDDYRAAARFNRT